MEDDILASREGHSYWHGAGALRLGTFSERRQTRESQHWWSENHSIGGLRERSGEKKRPVISFPRFGIVCV